jgi:ribosome-binding protein aMBF1 (putative translation factor)
LLISDDLNERITKAEKLVSDAEDAFAIGSKGHFKSLEELLKIRKKLFKAKDMLSEIKSSEQDKAIKILDDLEPLAKYIIEHSGLDPNH